MANARDCTLTHTFIRAGACPTCGVTVIDGMPVEGRPPHPPRWDSERMRAAFAAGDVEGGSAVFLLLVAAGTLAEFAAVARLAMASPSADLQLYSGMYLRERGRRLLPADFEWLRASITGDQEADLPARAMLIVGLWDRSVRQRSGHCDEWLDNVVWLLEHHPGYSLAGSPEATLPWHTDSGWERCNEVWLRQIDNRPDDPAVLANAGRFYNLSDNDRAVALFRRAADSRPGDPHLREQAGFALYLGISRLAPEAREARAVEAVHELEQALTMTESLSARLSILDKVVSSWFDARRFDLARPAAERILAESESAWADDMNVLNSRVEAALRVGRMDLVADDVASAKGRLAEVGRMLGDPPRRAFSPGLRLALRLLERGEQECVVEFLRLVAHLDQSGDHEVEMWIREIEAGRIPEFGHARTYH